MKTCKSCFQLICECKPGKPLPLREITLILDFENYEKVMQVGDSALDGQTFVVTRNEVI